MTASSSPAFAGGIDVEFSVSYRMPEVARGRATDEPAPAALQDLAVIKDLAASRD